MTWKTWNYTYGTWRNYIMANNTLAQIRARLTEAEKKKSGSFTDNTFFRFWDAKTDTTSIVRFVPDGNTANDYFWVEKLQIKLPFNGIKGGDTKQIIVNVPCVEMFGKEAYPQGCPILSEVRAWYKDKTLEEKANRYWKKATYIMQGFVRENAVSEESAPKNPIRKFSLNKQIFNLVKAGLMDPDMENLPCDYDHGTDFRIIKTQKGQYADYGTSNYARKESALTKVELDAIEEFGLSNLSEFLGKRPSEEELAIIHEMFEASVNGEAYDSDRWGKFYRPAGMRDTKENESSSNDSDNTEENTPVTSSKKETVEKAETKTATATSEGKTSAADILKMIKDRKKATN